MVLKEYLKKFKNGSLIFPDKKHLSLLDLRETEEAIKFIKDHFQEEFARALNLKRVSAPISVLGRTGINDYLTGKEMPVSFTIKATGEKAEIVQSLAKWKRNALADYGFISGEGLYTDMNAIRPDEYLDNLHSIYVDQWDWERIIAENERSLSVLKYIVKKIYQVIKITEKEVYQNFSKIMQPYLPQNIYFIHSQELADRYPNLSPRERENTICKEKGAVFIIGIGADLTDGRPHDERAADYDDWTTPDNEGHKGLNGDILVWYSVLNCALEISSMGIRVDKKALQLQLKLKDEEDKLSQYFHRRIMKDELPQSIGGGIGQSRLCMFFLRKTHIGEVQSSIWPDEMLCECQKHGIKLL